MMSKENTTKRENKKGSITQPPLSKQLIVRRTQHKEIDFKVRFTHTLAHTHFITDLSPGCQKKETPLHALQKVQRYVS